MLCLNPTRLLVVTLGLALLVLAGCSGRPNQKHIPRAQALHWHDPISIKVLRIWDLVRVPMTTEPELTHLVEVRVAPMSASETARTILLPYDSWATSRPPPEIGREMIITPSSWVRNDPRSRGAPR